MTMGPHPVDEEGVTVEGRDGTRFVVLLGHNGNHTRWAGIREDTGESICSHSGHMSPDLARTCADRWISAFMEHN